MKVLGMEVFPKRLSDDDYVQRARTQLRYAKWGNRLLPLLVLLLVWMLYSYNAAVTELLHSDAEEVDAAMSTGLRLGILMGTTAGFLVGANAAALALLLAANRTVRAKRLMVKFHDELEAEADGPDEAPHEEPDADTA